MLQDNGNALRLQTKLWEQDCEKFMDGNDD